MSENVQLEPVKSTPLMRRIMVFGVLLLLVFLLGFAPMWLKSRECIARVTGAEHELSLVRMENSLASAVIDARLGNYEAARQDGSDFFTALRTQTSQGDASVFSASQAERAQPLLAQRDEIITLLARSDPAAVARLSDLHVAFREILKQ